MISDEILNSRLLWYPRAALSTSDSYGKPIDSYEIAGSTSCTITSCRRTNSIYSMSSGQEVSYSHILYANPGMDMQEGDRVVVNGRTYTIVNLCAESGRGNHIRCGLVSVVL